MVQGRIAVQEWALDLSWLTTTKKIVIFSQL